jgi:hypothetical protein
LDYISLSLFCRLISMLGGPPLRRRPATAIRRPPFWRAWRRPTPSWSASSSGVSTWSGEGEAAFVTSDTGFYIARVTYLITIFLPSRSVFVPAHPGGLSLQWGYSFLDILFDGSFSDTVCVFFVRYSWLFSIKLKSLKYFFSSVSIKK